MKKKKQAITLIEIMVVILLIGLIGGALAINMKGSLNKGKNFKTNQNIQRLHDLLMLEYATGNLTLQQIKEQAESLIQHSSYVNDTSILRDAWNEPLAIEVLDDDLKITSKNIK